MAADPQLVEGTNRLVVVLLKTLLPAFGALIFFVLFWYLLKKFFVKINRSLLFTQNKTLNEKCPRCRSKLVRREKNNHPFVGCSRFPKCWYTRKVDQLSFNKYSHPTKKAHLLAEALRARMIVCKLEYFDGHKHIDIAIPESKIYIEIDGKQHFLNPSQIITDLYRDRYSEKDGFITIRIPNVILENNCIEVADAIVEVARSRSK